MDEPEHSGADVHLPQERAAARGVAREAEFAAFYRSSVPNLIGFLVLQGARPADAAEVVQEVMTKVWRSWDTLRSPLAWARVTAGREWVKRVASLEEDLVREFPERSVLLSSDTDIDQWIKCNHYYRLVAALPPRQRQVMVWTQEGYEPSEIAELLRLKPATVRSNLRKARSAIARYIEEGEQR